jgi:CubicO group peptidase (beta-lactamase class C family)
VRAKVAGAAALGLLLAGAAVLGLYLRPPELIRVGASYSAKMVCSNVFIAGRDAGRVLAEDVQAPGHPLLRLMRVNVERERGVVRAGLFGLFGQGVAIYRPGTGCASVPDGDLARAQLAQLTQVEGALAPAAPVQANWPRGQGAEPDPGLQALVRDSALQGPGARALVVVHRGRLVAETYGDGFNAATPLLGWSMTKTVTAGLIGMQIRAGHLALGQDGFWSDERKRIRLSDLMGMASGLRFNEGYGDVSDVTRMLFLESDMAAFAHAKPADAAPGAVWNYSSGTAVLLSRIWQQAAGDAALAYPYRALFAPLGMRSAVLEADARGNYVGSSYMYATAQDWARYGQFLSQDGVWNGERMLPEGFVRWMRTPVAPAHGRYGQGQVWLVEPNAPKLPDDTFWMEGHDGQFIAIVPSRELVLVRMGLTPAKLAYSARPLLAAVLAKLDGAAR